MSNVISKSWVSIQSESNWEIVVGCLERFIDEGNNVGEAYRHYISKYTGDFHSPVLNSDDFWAEAKTEDSNLTLKSKGEFGQDDIYRLVGVLTSEDYIIGFHEHSVIALYEPAVDNTTAQLIALARVD